MVAKVPKAKSGVKNKPHIKTLTKTIVKKKKNKAVNGIKEKPLKSMKNKKLRDLKKKAVAEEKAVKVLKKKLKSKKLKGKKKLKKKKKVITNEKSESSSLLMPENGKELIDTEEISPKEESSPVGSDTSTGGERSVVAEEMKSEPIVSSEVSISDPSSEFVIEETKKAISPKACKKDGKKAKKGKIKKANDGIIKKKDKVVKKKKGKVAKKEAVSGIKKAAAKGIKKKKLKKGVPMSLATDMKSDHINKEDGEFCGTLLNRDDGNTIGLEKDKEERDVTFNFDECINEIPENDDDNQKPSVDEEAEKIKSSIPVKKHVKHQLNKATDLTLKKKTKKNSGKKIKTEEVASMSFVLGSEQDSEKTSWHSRRSDTIMLKKRERELVIDLFGDLSEATKDVTTAHMVPKKKKKKLKKTVGDKKVPDDPFDIHMEISEPGKKPAWVDDDDENIRVKDVVASMTKARGTRGIRETSEKKYEAELREKFSNVIGSTPDWADLNYKPEEDTDDHYFIKKTGNYLSDQSSSLSKTTLEYKQMADLNSSHTEGAFIQAIDFNPHLQVGLVAGTLRNLGAASLFQVDGNANHKIQSVRFPSYPITSARFLRDGKKFIVGSNLYSYFYMYDLETSKETKLFVNKKFEKGVKKNLHVSPDGKLLIYLGSRGKVYLYDATTLSLVDMMEAPHPLTSATFTSDGSKMYTHGLTGEVCTWDLTARECVHKFYDEGCIAGDAIAVSPNNRYLACGSRSGIVNLYEVSKLSSESYPGPTKVLSNLTTNITALTFNASSEILAMASNLLPNAVKLVHFPSMTVFENFPRLGSVLKRSEAIQFSPQSGYLAVGDTAGAVPLFRLKHYSSY